MEDARASIYVFRKFQDKWPGEPGVVAGKEKGREKKMMKKKKKGKDVALGGLGNGSLSDLGTGTMEQISAPVNHEAKGGRSRGKASRRSLPERRKGSERRQPKKESAGKKRRREWLQRKQNNKLGGRKGFLPKGIL